MLELDVRVSICPPTGRGGHDRKIGLAKRKMEPSRFFRTFGAGPGAPCLLQHQPCLVVSMQKREDCPFLSQIRKLWLRRVHDQVKD